MSADQETIDQRIAECESRIAGNPKTAECLVGLNAEQRRQFAALEIDIEAQLFQDQIARHLREEAPARRRVMERDWQKVQQILERILSYAQDYGNENSLEPSLHLSRQIIIQSDRVAAEKALNELQNLPDERRQIASEHLPIPKLVRNAMAQLCLFLSDTCGLTSHQAQVRVARLRNAFWVKYGISTVPYRPEYIRGVGSMGCDAVQAAVRRFRQEQNR